MGASLRAPPALGSIDFKLPCKLLTREVLPVMPQLATPTHEESQSSSKRHASNSPGSVLSPLQPRKIFNRDTMAIMAYSAQSYDTHFTEQIETSETDPEFFDDDGSDSDQ